MLRRHASRPLLVGAALVAVLGPCVPAQADTHTPTATELKGAHQRVVAAQRRVASLQAEAEHAAEAYNGALLRVARARAASAAQAQRAVIVAEAYQRALVTAQAAQARAADATAKAQAAQAAQALAQAQADAAQQVLNRVAVGAFQTGGQLGMVSQLFLAKDPAELANGRSLIGRVSTYQSAVIAEMVTARNKAAQAAQATQASMRSAAQAAHSATAALDVAAAAKADAEAARNDAQAAAQDAVQAVHDAARIKALALRLVAQAQAALGSAVQRAAALEAAASAARADASQYANVDAPSPEAQTAIHWAFQEIGVPYSWGGGDENGPTEGFAQGAGTVGFDCSGLTLFAYHKAGISLDHYTGSQWNVGKRISSRSDLLPGDLMFFAYDTTDPNTIHHVSIYIGNGKMIEAPHTGDVVKVSSADRSDFIGATRPWA